MVLLRLLLFVLDKEWVTNSSVKHVNRFNVHSGDFVYCIEAMSRIKLIFWWADNRIGHQCITDSPKNNPPGRNSVSFSLRMVAYYLLISERGKVGFMPYKRSNWKSHPQNLNSGLFWLHHHQHHVVLQAQISITLSLSLAIHLYHPSGLLDYILCPYRPVVDKF